MSLFRRIRTPFSEAADEAAPQPEWPVHSVGRMLRERREELGLDLETAGAALRIKPIYLAALEQDRSQDLPGPAYAVGFIRAYAHYLGFDGTRVLERYKAESADVRRRPDLALPVPLGERSIPGGPILLVAAIIALCAYGTWYYLSTGARVRPERVAAVPAALQHLRPLDLAPAKPPAGTEAVAPLPSAKGGDSAAVALTPGGVVQPPAAPARPADGAPPPASPPAAGQPSPADGQPPRADAPPAAASGATPAAVVPASAAASPTPAGDTAKWATEIDIRATADCWIQVRDASNTILFSRVLKAGETYRVPRPDLIMRVGNAGALAIAVDGKAAPPLGPLGALRRDVVLDPQALLAGTAAHG